MVWSGADFGADIGNCHFICKVVSTEESVYDNYLIEKGSYPGKDQASPVENLDLRFSQNQGVTILIDSGLLTLVRVELQLPV